VPVLGEDRYQRLNGRGVGCEKGVPLWGREPPRWGREPPRAHAGFLSANQR
jgi:hypothetical protein